MCTVTLYPVKKWPVAPVSGCAVTADFGLIIASNFSFTTFLLLLFTAIAYDFLLLLFVLGGSLLFAFN